MSRETVNPFKEEIRERDRSNKLKGKVHPDKKTGDVSESINVGDEVLPWAAKSNKPSRSLLLSPFKVVKKTGSEVKVKNYTGVEFKRNAAFANKCHAQEGLGMMKTTEVVKALVRVQGKHNIKGHDTLKKTRKMNRSMLATKNQRSVRSRRISVGQQEICKI